MADLGEQIIDQVHSKLQIDECWTNRKIRSFSWIAHRLEQTVSTNRPIQDGEFILFKLSAETAVVSAVRAPDSVVYQVLSNLNQHSFGSCYSFDKSTQQIYATTNIWVHEQTAGWRSNIFDTYVIGQLCFAEAEADFIAEKCSGIVAVKDHPISGYRHEPDSMLDVIDELVSPKGQEPSRYSNAFEFEAVSDSAKLGELVATLGSSAEGIALESSFDNYTAISVLNSSYKHRLLGAGLSTWVRLPNEIDTEDGYRIASMLNLKEREIGPIGGQGHMGAWCVDESALGVKTITYRSFLPNIIYIDGLIMDTAMACVARMRWADRMMNAKQTTESAWKRLTKRFGVGAKEE